MVRAKRLHNDLETLHKQLLNGEKEPAVLKFLFDETISKAFDEENIENPTENNILNTLNSLGSDEESVKEPFR